MDKIKKALAKLMPKEKEKLKTILGQIKNGEWANLDLKKLKDMDDIFRVRVGERRIIFKRTQDGDIVVLALEKRNDNTYNY